MFTERYRPKSLQEYGFNTTSVVCQNYVNSIVNRTPMTGVVLLHGPAGSGKTTIVRCLARHYGVQLVEINASMEMNKDILNLIHNALNSRPLTGEFKILFLDEIDTLSTKEQKRLAEIISKVPLYSSQTAVFMACNHFSEVEKDLKSDTITVEVRPPTTTEMQNLAMKVAAENGVSMDVVAKAIASAKSYRDLLMQLETGGVSGQNKDLVVDDATERIRRILRGQESYLTPSEYWSVPAWLIDNTQGTEAASFDLWRGRYQRVGKAAEKYMRVALRGYKVPDPQFPWSVRVKVEDDAPKTPKKAFKRGKPRYEDKAPKKVASEENNYGVREAPAVPDVSLTPPTPTIDDFF